MAESYSLPSRHFELEHCVRFLEYKNSKEQLEHPGISRYKTFITSGPDTELLRFQSWLRDHDVEKILIYLRNFEICDLADYEIISNKVLSPTSELMVAKLVTMISTKDPHAFWYFVHAVKKFRGRNGLFEFFHGNINCCVCEEVQVKEKEIDDALSLEVNETALSPVKWPQVTLNITNWQLFHTFKSSLECKLKEDIKKGFNKRGKIFKRRLEELRQEVGPPLRELGRIVKQAFKNNDSPVFVERPPSRENGQGDVIISIPNEQLNEEQLKSDSESSCAEDDSEPVIPDEEAGYKRSTNPNQNSGLILTLPYQRLMSSKAERSISPLFLFLSLPYIHMSTLLSS